MFDILSELKKGAMLAPLAGFSDFAFRSLCKEFGAAVLVSEMISAKGLYYNDKKTKTLLNFNEFQRPFGIQIFGSDAKIMAIAADKILLYKPDFIDINMGCPTPKIVKNGDGSALLKNPKQVFEVTKSVVNAVNIPVSVKIRTGVDETCLNAPEIAKVIESAGANFITIHGRTAHQMYAPPVSVSEIRNVVNAVKIPVIGNGDVKSFEDAISMQNATGCSGIMIGRGAFGNPFIFEEIKNKLLDKGYTKPSDMQKIDTALHHLDIMVKSDGEKMAVLKARSHISMYIKGFIGSAKYKVQINSSKTKHEIVEILNMLKSELV